jgi:hypothetical protein
MAYNDLKENSDWKTVDLTTASVGQWEPNYDISLWKKKNKLHIFLQNVTQIDGEGLVKIPPTMISVLEINTLPK